MPRKPRCTTCRARSAHRHHVIYEQHVRRAGGDTRDPANLIPLCTACHAAHHNRQSPILLHRLPDSAYAYAAALLGPEAAHEYLSRRYSSHDPRHQALIP